MFRNLDREKGKKIDALLDTKVKVRKFVSRKEADAIKKALGNTEKLEKAEKDSDNTSKILKRLDRFDFKRGE